jgi:hypothetical protein
MVPALVEGVMSLAHAGAADKTRGLAPTRPRSEGWNWPSRPFRPLSPPSRVPEASIDWGGLPTGVSVADYEARGSRFSAQALGIKN